MTNKQIDSPFNFLRHSEYHICSWRLSSGTVTFIKNKIKHLPKKCLLLLVFVLLVWSESCSIVSNSLWPHGLSMEFSRPEYWSEYFRILNTETWSLSLLQVIFPIQGSKPGLLHCRWVLYQLSHKGSFCFRLHNFFFFFLIIKGLGPMLCILCDWNYSKQSGNLGWLGKSLDILHL